MSDLVERLQALSFAGIKSPSPQALACREAAARIEALEAENERMRLAMMGGEDAPGYAASVPIDDLIASFQRHERDVRAFYEAIGLKNERLRAALTDILGLDYKNAATNMAATKANEIARAALKD